MYIICYSNISLLFYRFQYICNGIISKNIIKKVKEYYFISVIADELSDMEQL